MLQGGVTREGSDADLGRTVKCLSRASMNRQDWKRRNRGRAVLGEKYNRSTGTMPDYHGGMGSPLYAKKALVFHMNLGLALSRLTSRSFSKDLTTWVEVGGKSHTKDTTRQNLMTRQRNREGYGNTDIRAVTGGI